MLSPRRLGHQPLRLRPVGTGRSYSRPQWTAANLPATEPERDGSGRS